MKAKEIVGRNLKWWRVDNGATLRDVGDRLGVTPATVSRWEGGTRVPNIDQMEAICEMFGKTLVDMVTYRP